MKRLRAEYTTLRAILRPKYTKSLLLLRYIVIKTPLGDPLVYNILRAGVGSTCGPASSVIAILDAICAVSVAVPLLPL